MEPPARPRPEMARNSHRHGLMLMAACALVARTAGAQPVPADAGWLPRQTAELRGLDKVTAAMKPLVVTVGGAVHLGSLTITVRACQVRPPDQPPDATAFLDIVDSRSGAPEFHGWMFANEPSINIFQHPVYDVRLNGCHG